MQPFKPKTAIPTFPVMLAPLAGTSDYPFRMVCQAEGADITFIEMLSATALLCNSKRTFDMMAFHPDERQHFLGVQLTGSSPQVTAEAVAKIVAAPSHQGVLKVIDINMGCPVRKVVGTGCGAAQLKNPDLVHETLVRARREVGTDLLLSVKIRLGWDHGDINAVANCEAAEAAGVDWITIHGRTRADDYSVPVDLLTMRACKRAMARTPIMGNGNIFSLADVRFMRDVAGVDGVMVSRGALGDPFLFRRLKSGEQEGPTIATWLEIVRRHLLLQIEAYGDTWRAAVCMRKHLLWYLKGWPGAKACREQAAAITNLNQAITLVEQFAEQLTRERPGETFRRVVSFGERETRQHFIFEAPTTQSVAQTPQDEIFHPAAWDPKYDMHRELDRGV